MVLLQIKNHPKGETKAYEYITSCRDEVLRNVVKVFNKTAREVCEGQQYDMNFEKNTTFQ